MALGAGHPVEIGDVQDAWERPGTCGGTKVGVKVFQSPDGRCGWANPVDPLYLAYHDEEWGVPEYDSRALWEKLVLDGFQAGLAWITILRKREAFRRAFANFDPDAVARFGPTDRARLMADPGIVRSNAKIDAAIGGARVFLDMRERGEDFSAFLWDFTDGRPIQNNWRTIADVPAQTPLAMELSKALKAEGFKFCGPVIVYAFMQAVGMVNDHVEGCFRHEEVARAARS
jgi:DNA-3-methyladenine glycosylase I